MERQVRWVYARKGGSNNVVTFGWPATGLRRACDGPATSLRHGLDAESSE